jgi:Flp pilus assembly protein TadD
MTGFAPDSDRRLLPRFRASAASVSSGDLRSFQPRATEAPVSIHFNGLQEQWSSSPTLELASELVCAGIVLGRVTETREAAAYLKSNKDKLVPELAELADLTLEGRSSIEKSSETLVQSAETRTKLARLKRRLANNPRNPIVWMDRAHLHTTLGQIESAKHAIEVAVSLAPNNRFVLRGASRFYVRAEDKDQGLHILRRSPALNSDPWLMAAEIALSTVNAEVPKSLRRARALLLNDGLDPWHTAELNGAFGTLAINDRSLGKPLAFFRSSLRNPTENAIAQAQWFSNLNRNFQVPAEFLAQRLSFEAQALKARADERWLDVVDACLGWSAMDPTSTRPLLLGSYVAEIALQDGFRALDFTLRWITTEPTNPMAWNNHAVALAYAGKMKEATSALTRLTRLTEHSPSDAVYLATGGLIEYRSGRRDAGRKLYLNAIDTEGAQKDRNLRALILWHLLREEARWDWPAANTLSKTAWENTKDIAIPELSAMKALLDLPPSRSVQHLSASSLTSEEKALVATTIERWLKPGPS